MTAPISEPAPDDVFSDRLTAWREYTATPWARIRYDVVAETLRRQCAAMRGARGPVLRVLDVGGGDGRTPCRWRARGTT